MFVEMPLIVAMEKAPELFTPEAFGPALVSAMYSHRDNTGENHLAGDVADTLYLLTQHLTAKDVSELFRLEKVDDLLCHSPYYLKISRLLASCDKGKYSQIKARKVARLIAEECGFLPISPHERVGLNTVFTFVLSRVKPNIIQELVNLFANDDHCFCDGDFPSPYSEFFKENTTQ